MYKNNNLAFFNNSWSTRLENDFSVSQEFLKQIAKIPELDLKKFYDLLKNKSYVRISFPRRTDHSASDWLKINEKYYGHYAIYVAIYCGTEESIKACVKPDTKISQLDCQQLLKYAVLTADFQRFTFVLEYLNLHLDVEHEYLLSTYIKEIDNKEISTYIENYYKDLYQLRKNNNSFYHEYYHSISTDNNNNSIKKIYNLLNHYDRSIYFDTAQYLRDCHFAGNKDITINDLFSISGKLIKMKEYLKENPMLLSSDLYTYFNEQLNNLKEAAHPEQGIIKCFEYIVEVIIKHPETELLYPEKSRVGPRLIL